MTIIGASQWQRAVRIGHRRPTLADATLAAYHARLERSLDQLLKLEPGNKAGLKLQRIIKRFRQNLFVCLTDRADLYADVRSVLETARRRGVGILHALRLTLDGQPLPSAA